METLESLTVSGFLVEGEERPQGLTSKPGVVGRGGDRRRYGSMACRVEGTFSLVFLDQRRLTRPS